ncbi:MAG TPA: mechanosensitive ion channel family protein [Euryarchaeota archaeon]|nr:mechanosensitive ion channel family protein [Euryarchaeota archaeon]
MWAFLNTELFLGMTIIKIILIFLMVFLLFLISKLIILSLRMSLKDKIPDHTMKIMENMVFYFFVLLALLAIISLTGINLGGFVFAGSIIGIVLGLAAQSSMANVVAGFLLLLESPFKIGDSISWGDHEGIVANLSLMSTSVRTFNGPVVRIPNEQLFTNAFVNNSEIAARRFEYDIEIRYRDDARKAIEIIKHCAEEHPLILKLPAPMVFVVNLGDHGVLLRCRFWSPVANWTWWAVYTSFRLTLREELLKEGIDIPFPQMTLWTDEPMQIKK